jgi:hypothetical protein
VRSAGAICLGSMRQMSVGGLATSGVSHRVTIVVGPRGSSRPRDCALPHSAQTPALVAEDFAYEMRGVFRGPFTKKMGSVELYGAWAEVEGASDLLAG